MPDDRDDLTWDPVNAQINALTAALGVLIGTLRAGGHLDDENVHQIFEIAEDLLPDPAMDDGAKLLAVAHKLADAVKAAPHES